MFFQGVAQPCLGRPVGKPGLELFPPEPGVQSDTGGSLQILGEFGTSPQPLKLLLLFCASIVTKVTHITTTLRFSFLFLK